MFIEQAKVGGKKLDSILFFHSHCSQNAFAHYDMYKAKENKTSSIFYTPLVPKWFILVFVYDVLEEMKENKIIKLFRNSPQIYYFKNTSIKLYRNYNKLFQKR